MSVFARLTLATLTVGSTLTASSSNLDAAVERQPVLATERSSRATFEVGPTGIDSTPQATLVDLYSQTDAQSTQGANSQNFEPVYDGYDNQAADDFAVPAGGWIVDTVVTPGSYHDAVAPAPSVHVTFYADAGGRPGAVACDYPALTTFTGATGSFTITLSPACALGAGPKWVSVYANMNFVGFGQWAWTQRTALSFNASVWKNPGDGFGTGCSSFTRRTECGVGTHPDQAFALRGTVPVCAVDADCLDGSLCNGVETCSGGSCAPGTPVGCDDGLLCTIDSCNPASGTCTHVADPCDDGDGCTADSCDEATGCAHVAAPPIQFCSSAAIALPASGAATPYPSTIGVAGVGASSSLCSVQLQGITHAYPDDIDVLLVGPGAVPPSAVVLSDVGGSTQSAGVDLTLRDAAPAPLPDARAISSGDGA
jgi:hypothetical protein